ncbi:MAG: SRPBCC family protein [Jatrophihabitans sp.]
MTNERTVTAHAGQQSIAFVREFDAPAALVFRAHTEAELLGRWTGPRGTHMKLREFDARTGGSWSYVIAADGGEGEWSFHGSFHEVTEASRIVQTFEFEGDPGNPTLEVLTFTDLDRGRSRIDGLSIFLSVQARDEMLNGMDDGMDENFKRLDELIASGELVATSAGADGRE